MEPVLIEKPIWHRKLGSWFVIILLIGGIVGMASYFFMFLSQNQNDGEMLNQQTLLSIMKYDLADGAYVNVLDTGLASLSSDAINEDVAREIFPLLVSAAGYMFLTQQEEVTRPYFFDIYHTLYKFASNPTFSNQFRAASYQKINETFLASHFNSDWLVEAMKQYEDNSVYARYGANDALITPESIAYSALFDLNAEAERRYPDRMNIAWQTWSVGYSMLTAPPPEGLKKAFEDYLHAQFKKLSESKFGLEVSNSQKIWIDQEILTLKHRMASANPAVFSISVDELTNEYEMLLNRVHLLEDEVIAKDQEYSVRISYASFLYVHSEDKTEIQTILQPLTKADALLNAPGVTHWLTHGKYNGDQANYLLKNLYEISLSYPELQQMLVLHGWKY